MRRRRRRIERACLAACATALLVARAPAAQEAEAPAAPPPGIAAHEAFLDEVRALRANFEQELWSAEGELIETSRGTMALERPNKFYWRYDAPYEQRIVADGEQVWIYDVELEQVTVAPLDSAHDASPALLLSGDEAVRDSFAVVGSVVRDGLEWVELEPELAGADFSSVRIGYDDHGAPRRIELTDGLGQVTRIELVEPELDPELPAELFEFRPPAGVDVIGADG